MCGDNADVEPSITVAANSPPPNEGKALPWRVI